MTNTPGPDRIQTLDAVRGVAVMGILLMNIIGFAMPAPAYYNPSALGTASGSDLVIWATMFVLIDGKMRGLFSFLFGASMLLVIDRAEAKGENPAAIHFRRMAWLLVFGLAHLYLLWWGDILSHYALVGMIAFAFRKRSVGVLLAAGILCIAIDLLLLGSYGSSAFAAYERAFAPGANAQDIEGWITLQTGFGVAPDDWLARDLATYRGGYGNILAHRWSTEMFTPLAVLSFVGPETLGYMLFGMAGLRSGMLSGRWAPARYTRWVAAGFGIGIPAGIALVALMVRHDFDTRYVILASMPLAAVIRPLMIAGWAALIVPAAARGGALAARIAAAGRMAFTNYLATSLICTTLFYGHGFGLYASLDRAQLYLIVLLICALMLLWSKPWLDRFAYGPLEWLWRSLARWKIQPMRRTRYIAT